MGKQTIEMLIKGLKFIRQIGPVAVLIFLAACAPKDSDIGQEVLIRLGNRFITVMDFNNAFEVAKIAYDNNIKDQPEELRKAQIRLLNQLIVELILLERAGELGIGITDAELENAVSAIKSDYPEGEFEKTLLEYAVSYDAWEKALRNRLIIEKVVDEELKNRITITPEDISEYYQKNYQNREEKTAKTETAQDSEDINEAIVKQLRSQKAEKAYDAWIAELKNQYAIEINNDQWEKITGSKNINENEKMVNDVSKSD